MKLTTASLPILITLIAIMLIMPKPLANANINAKQASVSAHIKAKNAQFVAMLNSKADPQDFIAFMDAAVAQDAKIAMTVNDPEHKAPAITYRLSKADYINSYLYGPRQIKHYKANLMTGDMRYDEQSQTISAKEILIESGITQDPFDHQHKGRPFTSTTICYVEHRLIDDKTIQLKSGQCNTDIAYEQSI